MSANLEFKFKVTDLTAVGFVEPELQHGLQTQLKARRFSAYLDWWTPSSLHPVFTELASFLTDREYWTQLRRVWAEVVTTRPAVADWLHFFNCGRDERQHLMSPADRRCLAALPRKVKVYWAGDRADGRASLCWMLDPEEALSHATWSLSLREQSPSVIPARKAPPTVAVGTCARKHILAVHTHYREQTIIIDPAHVQLKPEHLWLRA